MTEDEINAVLSRLQFSEPEAEAPRPRLSDVSLSRPRIDEGLPVTFSPSRGNIAPMASGAMSVMPSATGRVSVPAFGGELSAQGGYLPIRGAPPMTHHGFSFEKRFADGGHVDAALHLLRQHFDEGGFLDSLRNYFSSDGDYQSAGGKLIKDNGEVNWGDPESAADFFRADKARMALDKAPEVSAPLPLRRPAPEAVPAPAPAPAPEPQRETRAIAAPAPAPAPISFPYTSPFLAMPHNFENETPGHLVELPTGQPGYGQAANEDDGGRTWASPRVETGQYVDMYTLPEEALKPPPPQALADRAVALARNEAPAPPAQALSYAPPQAAPNAPAVAAINSAVAAPQIFPVNGTFVGGPASHYGAARGTLGDYARLHAGTDWQANNGTPVYSTTPGKVVYAGNHSGYGNMVDIAAPDGTIRRYAVHSGDVNVTPGTEIRAGQPIGTIGGQHLHHEVIRAGTPAAEAALSGQFGSTQRIGGAEHTTDPATVYGLKPGTAVIGPNGLPSPPKVTNRAVNYPEITDQEKDLIAKTIAAEASGKSPEEAHAIANVILNRAIAGGRYGKSIRDILLAENQFEPWSDESKANYPMKFKPGMPAYDAGAAALQKAYDAGDITGGSTYFWAPKPQGRLGRDVPGFAKKYPGFNIGATRFHRETRDAGGEVEGYAGGGDVVKQALAALRGGNKVFPKPQRMFPADARPPGGEYINAATGEAMTGQKPARAVLGVTPEGKPVFLTDPEQVDVTGSPGKGSTKTMTNLFRRSAGWDWRDAPEGYENVPMIVSTKNRNKHYYSLGADYPKGVDLARYPNETSEPRLKPTTQGNVYPGEQVGTIVNKTTGDEHPVYDMVTIRNLLAGTGAGAAGAAAIPDEARLSEADGGLVQKALGAIRGWHGSGKQFKQFDASKMGSGAGELFGRGVYITDTPDFARIYRDMGLIKKPGQQKIGSKPASEMYDFLQKQADSLPPEQAEQAYNKVKILEDLMFKGDPLAVRDIAKTGAYDPEAMSWFEGQVVPKLKMPGGLYEVDIKAKPEQFLQWEKRFGEQSPFIQDVLRPKAVEMSENANQARAQMLAKGTDFMGRPFRPQRLEELRQISTPETIGGQNLYGRIHGDFGTTRPGDWKPEANQFLRDKGVVGNTYTDAGMTDKGIQNYVVYDPADTEILNRYAHGGEITGDGAMRDDFDKGGAANALIRKALKTVQNYQDPPTRKIADWKWRPLADVDAELGLTEIPPHVQGFGDYMRGMSDKAAGPGLTARDLIKGYTTTRASIQRRATDADRLRQLGLDLPDDVKMIRPEGAWAEWLGTPMGKRFLDAAARGDVEGDAVANAIKIMSPFGRHETDIPDSMKWAAQNLPGREATASDLVARAAQGASAPEEWRQFTSDIRGVGPSKSGFLASLYGRGDQPTFDARQILLNTGEPTKLAAPFLARSKGEGGVEAVDRLAARQSALGLQVPSQYDPFYQHLAHHSIWDKKAGEMTTHGDVVKAMQDYAHGGLVDDALHVVREHHADGEAVGPTSNQRMRDTIASIDPERAQDQPVMDPATMGAAWQNSLKNLRNFPRQEGEAVARPLELGIRDQIGGAIGGEPRAPGADFRRGIADLLVGSTGLPDSGTLGFGLADAPMLTGVPLTLADMAHDVSQGDYVNAAANAVLPAAFYARGPLGAAGRRAVEIAKDYAKPAAATAAGVAANVLTPEDAEAAKLSKALQVVRGIGHNGGPSMSTIYSDLSKNKHMIPVEEMSAEHVPTIEMLRRTIVSPESLQGSILTPAVGDRTKAGHNLVGVNGEPLAYPVSLEGGPDFMRSAANQAEGSIWASDPKVISGIAKHGKKLGETGKDVNFIYSSMGARSGDFSHMMADALLAQMQGKPISREAMQELNDAMARQNPNWPGLRSTDEDAIQAARKIILANGPMRKQFAEEIALGNLQGKGFPDIGSTRYAITEPAMIGQPTGMSGYAISKLDPSGRVIKNPEVPHTTYPTQLGGKGYLGGFEHQIPREIMFPDFYAGRRAEGRPLGSDDRAFSLARVSQDANQQWLDNVMKYLERRRRSID